MVGSESAPGDIANDTPGGRYAMSPGARSPLLWILIGAAVVRLLLWAWFWDRPIRIEDEQDYHTIATNLVTRGEYALVEGTPTSLRPPLYPALLAGAYRVFGVGNFVMARLLQSAFSLVLVVLTYRLATTLYNRRVASWAAGFVAFYPSLLGFDNLILTEVLFTTLLVAACDALVRARRQRSLALVGLSGLLLGLGALTRSVLWPTIVPFGLWMLLGWGGRAGPRLLATGALVVAFVLTLAPWSIRNTKLEESFQTVDTMGGRNFMMGNYEHTPTYRGWAVIGLAGERNWFSVLRKAHSDVGKTTQGQRDKLAMKYGARYIRQHPGQTLKRDIAKFFDFWGLERTLIAGAAEGYFGPPAPSWAIVLLTLVIFGTYVPSLFLGTFGAVLRPPDDRWAHALLLLTMALICGAHTVTFGHPRYHLPLMPLVLIYAAAAVVDLPAIARSWRRPAFWLAVGLCAMFLVGWVWGILGPDSERFLKFLR